MTTLRHREMEDHSLPKNTPFSGSIFLWGMVFSWDCPWESPDSMAGSRRLDAWILQLADTPQELTKLRRRVMLQSISKQCCRPEPEDQKPPEPLYRLNEFQEVIALVLPHIKKTHRPTKDGSVFGKKNTQRSKIVGKLLWVVPIRATSTTCCFSKIC